jgi:hypothetical protein
VADDNPELVAWLANLNAWRAMSPEEQRAHFDAAQPRAPIDPAVRDAVNACPHRGPVLPVSMQPEGCGCGELSECRAGKGKVAGRVSLRDCLACKRD